MKIVILDGYTENPGDLSWDGLEQLGELTVYDRTPEEEIMARIGDAEAVLVNKVPLTEEIMTICPNMKYIGVLATGYNIIDIAAARKHGITVTNIPTYGTSAVAQYATALLLEVCHHVWAHSERVKAGDWTNNKDWCFWNYPLIELADKTLGIIGFGRIGQRLAGVAKALGMDIIAYDPFKTAGTVSEGVSIVTLEELYAKADVISLHSPLTDDNVGMINKNTISRMKDGIIILNTARGPLINEKDLAEALDSGKVGYAAVDVVSVEPIREDNPLLTARNCIITPHIAWAARESRARLMDIAVNNLKAFIDGKPESVVN